MLPNILPPYPRGSRLDYAVYAGGKPTRTAGSSIYPAVQNMILAARALSLGATLTTLYLNFEKEVEAALGLPPDVHSYALIPMVIRWAASGRFAERRSPKSSSKTDGDSLTVTV
jgi:nitroreductase